MAISALTRADSDLLPQQLFSRHERIPLHDDLLWQIERGAVRSITWTEEGTLVTLGYWGLGDMVGRSLSQIDPYQLECLTVVEAKIIPKEQWYQSLNAMLLNIQQTQELLRIVHQNPIEQRLWQFLVWFGQKFGCDTEQGRLIDMRLLTHEDIAAAINSTRVTVTRVLQQLQSEGMLRRHKRQLILLGAYR